MRRRREAEAGEKPATRPGSAAATPADRVLALQQSAGNHAVTGMLAREAAEKEKPRYAVTIEEIGRIPILSFQFGVNQAVTGGGATGGRDADGKEITFHSEIGEHTGVLIDAYARGTQWEKAVVRGPGVQWTFSDAIVTSHQTSSAHDEERPRETWSLTAAKFASG